MITSHAVCPITMASGVTRAARERGMTVAAAPEGAVPKEGRPGRRLLHHHRLATSNKMVSAPAAMPADTPTKSGPSHDTSEGLYQTVPTPMIVAMASTGSTAAAMARYAAGRSRSNARRIRIGPFCAPQAPAAANDMRQR